jgi:hypothetical protein
VSVCSGLWRDEGDEKVHEKTEVAKRKEIQLDKLAERVGFEPYPTFACP